MLAPLWSDEYLIVPITIAAFANLGLFSPERPLAIFYLATYVVVGMGLAWVLWDQRDLT